MTKTYVGHIYLSFCTHEVDVVCRNVPTDSYFLWYLSKFPSIKETARVNSPGMISRLGKAMLSESLHLKKNKNGYDSTALTVRNQESKVYTRYTVETYQNQASPPLLGRRSLVVRFAASRTFSPWRPWKVAELLRSWFLVNMDLTMAFYLRPWVYPLVI